MMIRHAFLLAVLAATLITAPLAVAAPRGADLLGGGDTHLFCFDDAEEGDSQDATITRMPGGLGLLTFAGYFFYGVRTPDGYAFATSIGNPGSPYGNVILVRLDRTYRVYVLDGTGIQTEFGGTWTSGACGEKAASTPRWLESLGR